MSINSSKKSQLLSLVTAFDAVLWIMASAYVYFGGPGVEKYLGDISKPVAYGLGMLALASFAASKYFHSKTQKEKDDDQFK